MGLNKADYKLVRFEKSKAKNKKYAAILKDKEGKERRVNFGDIRYEHYKDSTPLKLYSKLDHNDKERRRLYRARHKGYLDKDKYSPAYFSWFYLW
jgi:hypothetical protein